VAAGEEAEDKRTRWETSRRLGWLFGVVPRIGRIETLKCGQAVRWPSSSEGGWRAGRQAHEGRASAQRLVWQASEGRKARRASASARGQRRRDGERTLGWSKASKPGLCLRESAPRPRDRTEWCPGERSGYALRRMPRPLVTSARWLATDRMRLMSSDLPPESHEPSPGISARRRSEPPKRRRTGARARKGSANPTAREQRAPRGVAAGRVGKALKAEIPWAAVA